MPQLQAQASLNDELNISDGASGLYVWGLNFDVKASAGNFDQLTFISCGSGSATTVAGLSSNIHFDQILIQGSDSPISDTKHGINVACNQFALTNSWAWHIHQPGFDTQVAFIGNETGPGILDNNYFWAAGEHIIFGGVNISLPPGNEPSDWTVARNDYELPLTYRISWSTPPLGVASVLSASRDVTGTVATFTENSAGSITPHPGDLAFIPAGSMTDGTFDEPSGCTILTSPVPTKTTFSCSNTGTASASTTNASYTVTNASWASGTATITVASTGNLTTSSVLNISGITPNGYNTAAAGVSITAVTPTTFSYAVSINPGTYVSGGLAVSRFWETDPSYAFSPYPNQWDAKNVQEMKYGKRALFRANSFCCAWPPAQSGRAIALNVTGTGIGTYWTSLEDITLVYNRVPGWSAGMFEPADGNNVTPGLGMHRVYFAQNLGYGGNGDSGFYILNLGGSGVCPNCDLGANPFSDVQEAHNTWVTSTASSQVVPAGHNLENSGGVAANQTQFQNFMYRDNVLDWTSTFGLFETSCKIGLTTTPCTTASNYNKSIFYNTVSGNCTSTPQWGSSAASCPVATQAAMKFVDVTHNNYQLLPTSPGFHAASDGTDVGADVIELNRELYGVYSGQWPTHRVISHGSIKGASVR